MAEVYGEHLRFLDNSLAYYSRMLFYCNGYRASDQPMLDGQISSSTTQPASSFSFFGLFVELDCMRQYDLSEFQMLPQSIQLQPIPTRWATSIYLLYWKRQIDEPRLTDFISHEYFNKYLSNFIF